MVSLRMCWINGRSEGEMVLSGVFCCHQEKKSKMNGKHTPDSTLVLWQTTDKYIGKHNLLNLWKIYRKVCCYCEKPTENLSNLWGNTLDHTLVLRKATGKFVKFTRTYTGPYAGITETHRNVQRWNIGLEHLTIKKQSPGQYVNYRGTNTGQYLTVPLKRKTSGTL